MIKKIFFFLCLICFTQNANALCEKIPIQVTIKAQQGQVFYDHTHSQKEFQKLTNHPYNPRNVGLTVPDFKVFFRTKNPFVKKDGNRFCIGIKEIEFYIGYDEIKVYIDKKYPKNSCNYRVIKDHEDYHVGVCQEAIAFFRPDIERELQKAIADLRPEHAYSQARAQQVIDKQFKKIHERLAPLLKHINEKIAEKNYAIDTPESYEATTRLCPRW